MGTKTGRDARIQLNLPDDLKTKVEVISKLEGRDVSDIAEQKFREVVDKYPEDTLEKLIERASEDQGKTLEDFEVRNND